MKKALLVLSLLAVLAVACKKEETTQPAGGAGTPAAGETATTPETAETSK